MHDTTSHHRESQVLAAVTAKVTRCRFREPMRSWWVGLRGLNVAVKRLLACGALRARPPRGGARKLGSGPAFSCERLPSICVFKATIDS